MSPICSERAQQRGSALDVKLLDRRVTKFGHPLAHLVSEYVQLVVAHLHRRRAQIALLFGGAWACNTATTDSHSA